MNNSNNSNLGQQTCILTFVSAILILVYIFSNKYSYLFSKCIKLIIMIILIYTIFVIGKTVEKKNIIFDTQHGEYIKIARRNVLLKSLFIVTLILLFFSVLRI
jgi:hypothetical protein